MSSKKSTKGKRYSDSEKNEVVQFVLAHDAERGRGGKSAAAKKFNVSPITLASWIKGGEKKPSKRSGRPVKGVAKSVSTKKATGGNLSKLKELTDLAGKIHSAEVNLQKLRDRFDAIKVTL